MKFKQILFLEIQCLMLVTSLAFCQQTPTPVAAPRAIPTLAVPTMVFPRTDVKTTDDQIQPPADSNSANDNLGFYGSPSAGNLSTASTNNTPNPQTVSNNETIQKTVTALLANPGFNIQDDLNLSPTPGAAGQTTIANTPNTLVTVTPTMVQTPHNTAVPSLKDISTPIGHSLEPLPTK